MKQNDYLKIVLDGYLNRREFLSDHFYGEFKEAEKKHIRIKEFITGIENVIQNFKDEIIQKSFLEKNKLGLIRDSLKKKGESVKEIEGEIKQLTPYHFPIQVNFHLQDFSFIGKITLNEIEIIESEILKFSDRYKKENSPFRMKTFKEVMEKNEEIDKEVAIREKLEERRIQKSPPEATGKQKSKPMNKKLTWNGGKNILGEIFFQLKKELKNPDGKFYIEGNDEIIAEMLCEYFSNIDSKETFITYLNPSKGYNKPQKVKVKVSIEEIKK